MKNLKLTLSTLAAGLVGVSSIAALTTLTSCNEGEKWDTVLSSKDEADAYLAAHVHKISSTAKSAASATDPEFLTVLKNGINGQNLLNAIVLASKEIKIPPPPTTLSSNYNLLSAEDPEYNVSSTISFNNPTNNHVKAKLNVDVLAHNETDGVEVDVEIKMSTLFDLTINDDKSLSGKMSATLNYNGMPPITQESNLDK
jgi:hypothetical protein